MVDDEPGLLTLLSLVLETEQFLVLKAASGADALKIFSDQLVDVAILDFLMPGMDGGEVAEQMRRLRPEVPIVMLSACLTVPEQTREIVDGFVEKGMGTGALLRAVRRALDSTCDPTQPG